MTLGSDSDIKRPRSTGPLLFVVAPLCLLLGACEQRNPELVPDEYLQSELGLTDDDRVHSITITGGTMERADPEEVHVRPGDFVQFVSSDWRVHEITFDLDALPATLRHYLESTNQIASPPLLQQGSRFVLGFSEAPAGSYPYLIAGNTEGGRGTIVVESDSERR